MSEELSILTPRQPHPDICQWVKCEYSHHSTDPKNGKPTVHVGAPPLMPGTIIFVHGVNSEGEWYEEAAKQIAEGLKKRLGRKDLEALVPDGENKKRFLMKKANREFIRSPILPFYWGYKLQPGDKTRYPGIYHDTDDAWGGGPFQNGTNNLPAFWQPGFKRRPLSNAALAWLVDLNSANPEPGRQLMDAPPRDYMIHAARRLAYLIDDIRKNLPNEPVNIVAHSQGNMITLLAMLFLEEGTRAPDTLILNNAPYAFDTKLADWLTSCDGWCDVQTEAARVNTFAAVAERIAKAKAPRVAETNSDDCALYAPKGCSTVHMQYNPNDTDEQRALSIGTLPVNEEGQRWDQSPLHSRAEYDGNQGKVFVNFNPNDRVIGIASVSGIGWRGIDATYLNDQGSHFPNVYQRIFVRNMDGQTVTLPESMADPLTGKVKTITHYLSTTYLH